MSSAGEMTKTKQPRCQRGNIRILATTDLHNHLLGFDYYSNRPTPNLGLSRIATLVEQARVEAAEQGAITLLFDNGDGLQGTPIGERSGADSGGAHPLMTAFSVMGYDAIGLGNHDFNFGLADLTEILTQAPCPVVCSNMDPVQPDLTLPFAPKTIIEKQFDDPDLPPVRIGVLSVLPPQTLIWDAHFLMDRVVVHDMVQAAQRTARDLRTQGCDLVIALAHTGLGAKEAEPGCENALYPLSHLEDIDAIVAGHTHLLLPDPQVSLGCPAVMPGAFSSHLGTIDIALEHGDTGWQIRQSETRLQAVSSPTGETPEHPDMVAALADDHAATLDRMREPVGHHPKALHSYFTFFAPDESLVLSANAQAAAVRAFTRGTEYETLPLLSAVAPGKFGGRAGPYHYTDVAAGEICMRNVVDLQIFPNELRAMVVTGQQVRDWLEMSAGVFHQVPTGSTDRILFDPQRVGHNFDVIFGVNYEIDLSSPARFSHTGLRQNPQHRRIRNLRWQGQPIPDTQRFVVAMNNYRAGGGGQFNMLSTGEHLKLPPVKLRKVLRDFLAAQLPIESAYPPAYPWRFCAQPETQVTAFTGPEARRYLTELDPARVQVDPINPNGFLPLRISL